MLKLDDIRKSVAWQEALQEGREEGRRQGLDEGVLKAKQDLAKKFVAEGRSLRDVAELLDISQSDVRRWTTD